MIVALHLENRDRCAVLAVVDVPGPAASGEDPVVGALPGAPRRLGVGVEHAAALAGVLVER